MFRDMMKSLSPINRKKYLDVIKMAEKMPIKSWKCGLIELAQWENENDKGEKYLSYSLTRSFQITENEQKVWKQQKINLNTKEAGFLLSVLQSWNVRNVKVGKPEAKKTE